MINAVSQILTYLKLIKMNYLAYFILLKSMVLVSHNNRISII